MTWSALHDLLDARVHELYLAADAEFPYGPDGDRDAVQLHCLMVEHDAQCLSLVRAIDARELAAR